jgi:hypothetical protein
VSPLTPWLFFPTFLHHQYASSSAIRVMAYCRTIKGIQPWREPCNPYLLFSTASTSDGDVYRSLICTDHGRGSVFVRCYVSCFKFYHCYECSIAIVCTGGRQGHRVGMQRCCAWYVCCRIARSILSAYAVLMCVCESRSVDNTRWRKHQQAIPFVGYSWTGFHIRARLMYTRIATTCIHPSASAHAR